jgi:hypothetical protein
MKQRQIQRPGVGTFTVRENVEHMARAAQAIRLRRLRETSFEVAA